MNKFYLIVFAIITLAPGRISSQLNTFEIETVQVRIPKPEKRRIKSPSAFFSIAWSDVFGQAIPESEVGKLINAYAAIGDKDLLIQIFLKTLIWGEESNVFEDWVLWLFDTEKMMPSAAKPKEPAEVLFMVQRTMVATQNFNPRLGNSLFLEWTEKNSTGVKKLLEISNENKFREAAISWAQILPEEWEATQRLADSLLGVWEKTYQGEYASLRELIIKYVAPLYPPPKTKATRINFPHVSHQDFRQNPEPVIYETFQILLNREPDPFELWYFKKKIKELPDFNVQVLFYGIMLSEEYMKY